MWTLITLMLITKHAFDFPQIKVGEEIDKDHPSFDTYEEMIALPTPPKTYGDPHVFEEYFASSFEGRYVVLQKTNNGSLQFQEAMVWVN